MPDGNVEHFDIIDNFNDQMYIWILDPTVTPQSKRYLLSKFIQEMRITFAVDTGAANAYAIAMKSPVTALVKGQSFTFQAANANTGTSTIKIDALGVKTIKRRDGTDLQSGDIPTDSINIVQYDGINFQLMVSSGGVGGGITASQIQNSAFTFDVDTGAADAYVITLSPAISAYAKGQLFYFEAVNANLTTTPTININGQGAQTIINRNGTALAAGDIPANSLNIIQYDGTNFQLLVSLGGGGSSAGSAGEVQTSNGAGGFVASKLFFDETLGSMFLGDAGLGGSNRAILASGSEDDIDVTVTPKGDGSNILNGNSIIGIATSSLIGHYGATAVSQPVKELTTRGALEILGLQETGGAEVAPNPSALSDGAAIAFDLNTDFFNLLTLDTTTTTITLTLSNVIQAANQILSVKKNTASDVTITLAGAGLTFYGYNGADLNGTPVIVLSGASGDIFDISFLARTATEIGVALGINGN